MLPSEAIKQLHELENRIESRVAQIHAAAHNVRSQWDGLCEVGGAREDHAVELLVTHMLSSLRRLGEFCDDCAEQIERMVDDPWQE